MELGSSIRSATTIFAFALLCACGGGSGGSNGSASSSGLATPIADLTGTWTVNESGVSNCAGLTTYTNDPFQISIAQTANNFTVTAPAGTFNGVIDGDKASWTGSYPSGSGRTAITAMRLVVAAGGATFSGSADWSWTDGMTSCFGTSQSINATRVTGSGAVPAAPNALAGTPQSSSSVTLVWNDNATNELGFKVERRLSGDATAAFAQIALLGVDVKTFTDTGLNAQTAYDYRVRAYNAAGDSAFSNVATVTTLAAPVPAPQPPSGLTLTVNSPTSITLRWTDNSANETAFRIERSLNADTGFAEIATVNANTTTLTDTGLSPATHYFYRVRASNTGGNSAYSNTANATTEPLVVAPNAPSNLGANAASPTRIDLTWTDNSNNETGFKIERSLSATTGFSQIATTAAGVTTFSDTGATPATTFFYRVRATNSANGTDSGFSNVASATTPALLTPPAAPSGLKATAASNNRIDLTWKDNSNNETGFKIERSLTANSGFTQIAVTGANATSFSDTGLQPMTRFFYRVRATNAAGDSNFTSDDVTTPR